MSRNLASVQVFATAAVTVAAIALAAVALTAVAAAGPASAKQRVTIDLTGANASSFVLTPVGAGAITGESGHATFCCWSQLHVVRDGQTLDLNNPRVTLTGKRGTLVTRNRVVWMDLPNGLSIYTGTWKVIGGTGAYANLTGGGLAAGVVPDAGKASVRFTGFLSPK